MTFEVPPPCEPAPSPALHRIRIYHPGYEKDAAFLTLSGRDGGGVWQDTARTACAVLSGNRFDGQFKNRERNEEIPPDQEILSAGDYVWILPDDSEYPIITTFRDWWFPQTVPDSWNIAAEVDTQGCQVTRDDHGRERAHVIPSAETQWFYGTLLPDELGGINDDVNILSLRADLHHEFDQHGFTFVPKKGKMVLHCMGSKLARYHNLPLQGRFNSKLMLARFAWTLLYSKPSYSWLMKGFKRAIWVTEGKREEYSPSQCADAANLGRVRSTSPKKRKQTEQMPPSIVETRESSQLSFDSGLGTSDDTDYCEPPRGRKRIREDTELERTPILYN